MSLACLAAVVLVAASQTPDPPEPCRVHGRLVDVEGQPVVGATIQVGGWQANSSRVRQYGLPQNWTAPTQVESGDDGAFEVSFVPPRAFQFTLDVDAPGLGRVGWRWSGLEGGSDVDLGTTTLQPEAVVVGYLRTKDGELLAEGWRISAWEQSVGRGGSREPRGARSTVDPETGRFRITGLAPGVLRIDASGYGVSIPAETVTTVEGKETLITLVYDGPDPARLLQVRVGTQPFHGFRPGAGAVTAVAPDGTRLSVPKSTRRSSLYELPDVPPGEYIVEVRDPRYRPLDLEGVRPGEAATARLEGASSLVLDVVDGDTGNAVTDYDLDVGYEGVNFSPSVYRIRERAQSEPPGGRYDGIVPGDIVVQVHAEGWPVAFARVEGLGAGEERAVEVTLVRGEALTGVVLDPSGQPVAGVEVQLTRGDWPGHDDPLRGSSTMSSGFNGESLRIELRYRDAACVTDADGRFEFTGLGAGVHALRAVRGLHDDVFERASLPLAADEGDVVLRFAESSPVTVRLQLPEDVPFDEVAVMAVCRDPSTGFRSRAHPWRRGIRSGIDDLWAFDEGAGVWTERLPVGTWHLMVGRAMKEDGEYAGMSSSESSDLVIESSAPVEVTKDLRASYPRMVDVVHPTSDGEALRDVQVHLVPEEGSGGRVVWSQSKMRDGRFVHSKLVRPGRYEVVYRGGAALWRAPENLVVEGGDVDAIDLQPPFLRARLRLLDSGGAPLADAPIACWHGDDLRYVARTDAEGRVELLALAEPLHVARLDPEELDVDQLLRNQRFSFGPVKPSDELLALEPEASLEALSEPGELRVELPAR